MSTDPDNGVPIQEPDRIDRRTIMAVTVGWIVISTIALAIAWIILDRAGEAPRRGRNPPTAPRTIGTLEQTLILHTQRGVDLRRQQEASLHQWEWIDRDAGLLRIPIESAMAALASEGPDAGALPPSGPEGARR